MKKLVKVTRERQLQQFIRSRFILAVICRFLQQTDIVILTNDINDSNIFLEILFQNASENTVCQLGLDNLGQITAIESSNCYSMALHNSISVDGHGSILSCDDGDDYGDLVILGEEVNKSIKRKTIAATHQIVVCISCYLFSCSRLTF